MKVATLTQDISAEGIGLHTGARTTVIFHPTTKPGISFRAAGKSIPARLDSVIDTTRGVSLGTGGAVIKTVEHLLAALLWLGVRDADIEVRGEEIPVMDGSALSWIHLLKAGVKKTDQEWPVLKISNPVSIDEGGASVKVFPADEISVSYTIDFPNTPIGRQTWQASITPEIFEAELAPARTFGFLEEVEALRKDKLARGGNWDNCVVISRSAFLTPLRFNDEMVRHKVLDLMGDLALLERVPKARWVVEKGSHRLHVAMAKALLKCIAKEG